MISYALMDETGQIPVALGRSARPPVGAMHLPNVPDVSALAGRMLVDGSWIDRPTLAAPVITQTAAGWMVAYVDVPDGAICDVADRDLGWLDRVDAEGGAIEFTLPDAGPYQLEITAPLPWLGRTDNVVLA